MGKFLFIFHQTKSNRKYGRPIVLYILKESKKTKFNMVKIKNIYEAFEITIKGGRSISKRIVSVFISCKYEDQQVE